MFAQADLSTDLGKYGAASVVGLLAMLLHYLITKGGPQERKQHSADMAAAWAAVKEVVADNKIAMQTVCETFKTEMAQVRTAKEKDREVFREAVHRKREVEQHLANLEAIEQKRISKGVSSTKPGDSGIGSKSP